MNEIPPHFHNHGNDRGGRTLNRRKYSYTAPQNSKETKGRVNRLEPFYIDTDHNGDSHADAPLLAGFAKSGDFSRSDPLPRKYARLYCRRDRDSPRSRSVRFRSQRQLHRSQQVQTRRATISVLVKNWGQRFAPECRGPEATKRACHVPSPHANVRRCSYRLHIRQRIQTCFDPTP